MLQDKTYSSVVYSFSSFARIAFTRASNFIAQQFANTVKIAIRSRLTLFRFGYAGPKWEEDIPRFLSGELGTQ